MLTIELPNDQDIINMNTNINTNRMLSYPSPSSESLIWANEAMDILNSHIEMEQRHFLVDGMIEYVQKYYKKVLNNLNPSRKAYSFFFQEKQPKIAMIHKKKGPNEKFQIAKKVSLWWKRMSTEEKKIYYLLESVDQLRYDQDVEKIKYYHDKDVDHIENIRSTVIKQLSSEQIKDWINNYKNTLVSM